ncbi:hypothetical protein N644_1694 [Lactiplantibacillus paraplantarum]|uniref:Uncharacterized protein n=1 Tax=Lactiplantibacillus paraplantarum TaxID=60520 RepID=A0ABQ0N6I8_9LACO|nr:hypothetical protein N644_1694 [Lactiplantibacillus paraplantarum]GBF00729.1 hypothetical protein LPPLD21_00230 [Lactiplantibacillus paraplantarum]
MFNKNLFDYFQSLSAVDWTVDIVAVVIIAIIISYLLYKKLHH